MAWFEHATCQEILHDYGSHKHTLSSQTGHRGQWRESVLFLTGINSWHRHWFSSSRETRAASIPQGSGLSPVVGPTGLILSY